MSDSFARGSVRMIDLPVVTDRRGDLTFVEGGRHVPFDIAPVYYLYNVPVDAERGGTRTGCCVRSCSRFRAAFD
mgnify:FL=1